MKPFTDAGILKQVFVSTADILFEKYSNKKQILSDIKKTTAFEFNLFVIFRIKLNWHSKIRY